MKRGDWIILALAVLLALFPLALRPETQPGACAVVRKDGQIVARLPLDQPTALRLEEGGLNVLRVEDGAVYMEQADCPDRTCVASGPIRTPGQVLACLPHRLTVVIEGDAPGVDAVTQ